MSTEKTAALQARAKDLLRLVELFPPEVRAMEADVVAAKWPGYRFLSPLEANRLFHEAFTTEYKRRQAFAGEGARQMGKNVGQKPDMTTNNARHTQLYNARLFADATGMPYATFMAFTYGFQERRTRKYPAQPNQLKPSPQAEAAWRDAFDAFWNADMQWTILPFAGFDIWLERAKNKGLPVQSQFRTQLVELHRRGGAVTLQSFLAQAVFRHGWLTPEDVRAAKLLGDHDDVLCTALERVKADVENGAYGAPPPRNAAAAIPLQSCFGIPGIDTAAAATCSCCPDLAACNRLRDSVIAKTTAKHGTPEPLEKAARASNRKRQQAFRDRKKAGRLPPTSS